MRQRMQVSLHQTADAGVSLSDIDAGDTLSESGCMSLSLRKQMQEYLHQTADAGVSPSDSGFSILSIRQRMQETLY